MGGLRYGVWGGSLIWGGDPQYGMGGGSQKWGWGPIWGGGGPYDGGGVLKMGVRSQYGLRGSQ